MSSASLPASNFQKVFKAYVGPRREFSIETVAERTGFDPRTVKAHYAGETEPGWAKMLAYIDLLGEAFANALLAPVGMGGVQSLEVKPVSPHAQLAELAARCSDLARALEDGRIDHREAANLAPLFRQLGIKAIEFASWCEAKGEG